MRPNVLAKNIRALAECMPQMTLPKNKTIIVTAASSAA
jgi:hypothetical protein